MLAALLLLTQVQPTAPIPASPIAVTFPFEATGGMRVVRSITLPKPCELIRSIARIQDLDGDGTPDVVAGGGFSGYPPMTPGFVAAFSTTSGKQLWIVRGADVDEYGGEALGFPVLVIDDMNGDGVSDVLAGAPRFNNFEGRIYFISGKDGKQLATLRGNDALQIDSIFGFGASARVVGDIDRDGVRDLILGDEFFTCGKCGIFSGKTRKLIHAFEGGVIGGTGDIDGDSIPDVVISPALEGGSATHDMRVEPTVRSGATGKVVRRLGRVTQLGRVACADVGDDFDADGCPDILLGVQVRPEDPRVGDKTISTEGELRTDRRVLVLSAKTSKPILDFATSVTPTAWVATVQSVSDLNGDDNPDLVVQSWISNESRLSVHSGKDGSSILRLDKNPIQDLYKSCVCDFGDTDGNGRREIAIGAFSTRDMVSVGAIHFVELTEGK